MANVIIVSRFSKVTTRADGHFSVADVIAVLSQLDLTLPVLFEDYETGTPLRIEAIEMVQVDRVFNPSCGMMVVFK